MLTRPLVYPRLSHQQAVLNNLVCGLTGVLQTRISDSPCQLSARPVVSSRQFDFQLTFEVDGLPVQVLVPRELFDGITIADSPLGVLLGQLPHELKMGCVATACKDLFDDVRALVGKEIRLVRIDDHPSQADTSATVEIVIQTERGEIQAHVRPGEQQTRWLSHRLHGAVQGTNADQLPVPVALLIGSTALPVQKVAGLCVGDIILFDRNWHHDRQQLLLRVSSHIGFIGQLDGHQITVQKRLTSTMSNNFDDFDDFDFDDDFDLSDSQPEDSPAAPSVEAAPMTAAAAPAPAAAVTAPPAPDNGNTAAPSQGSGDIQGLPVKLLFDVGTLELTVAELGRLGPGYTLSLNRDPASPVVVKANGKPFAQCELVQINDQIGARILRLL